jgi:HupF/HypC family
VSDQSKAEALEPFAVQTCVTCADEARTMRVLEVDRESGLALCAASGRERVDVEVGLVDPVQEGELLLVHAGVALGRAPDPCESGR